jgi:hypothetical protein
MIYLACKHCGSRVSNFLELSRKQWSWTEFSQLTERDLVEAGYYFYDTHKDYILNLLDKRNLFNHPDLQRFAGCCGPGLEGEPNLICQCKQEIGREIKDCMTPYFIKIIKAKVYEVRDDWQLFPIFSQAQSLQVITEVQLEQIVGLLKYGQVKEGLDCLRQSLQSSKAEELMKELNTLPNIKPFDS